MNTFEFKTLENKDFKEDSVREFIISPLLQALGFVPKDGKVHKLEMVLTRRLKTNIQIGSNKKIEADLNPDYALYVNSKLYCILDAKAPSENIEKTSKNYSQAKSYALGFECPYFALCNGHKFVIYAFGSGELMLELELERLNDKSKNDKFFNPKQDLHHFLVLKQFFTQEKIEKPQLKKPDSWYLNRELPGVITKPQKQAKARYFGCTAYFTRQSWDIVTQNIKNFTNEGDVVLDSFGGSGVTAIEAMMQGRIGIHTDLNPLSIFMVKALSAKVDLSELYELSETILREFENLRPKNEKEAKEILKNAKYYPNAISEEFGEVATQKEQDSILWIPQNELLPKGSDVDCVLQLFSKKQLAELALLRKLIFKKTTPSGSKEQRISKRNMRYSLMLSFYNTLSLINLTYHATPKGGGNYFAFYYRYRLAPKPTFLDTAVIYRQKVKRVLKGKKELEDSPVFYDSYFFPTKRVIKDFKNQELDKREQEDFSKVDSLLNKTNGEKIFQADATNLREIESQSIDFIYTDPPYGAKIPYLDLSTMWNVWLDLPVDSSLKEKECIEKGSLEKSREEYHTLMIASLKEMYRVLKYNRWLAFVFQHQDPQLWQILVEEAQKIGFEYVGSVRQGNGQTTFKKRQYKTSVLSGQLIIYFKKVKNPKTLIKEHLGDDITALVLNHAEALIARDDGASLEEIHAEITIKGLELGFLHRLGKDYADLTPLINANFDLDETSGKYHIKKGQKFKSHAIPLEKRAKYFLLSYLRGAQRQGKKAYFDDICLEILPLLKNGVSPSNELIKEILEDIAMPNYITGEWRLKEKEHTLFDNLY